MPPPPAEVDALARPQRTWLSGIRDFYEHMEYAWLRSFMSFDESRQALLFQEVERSLTEAASSQEHWMGRALAFLRSLPSRAGEIDTLGRTLLVVIIAAIVLALGSLLHLLIVRRRRMAALQLDTLPRARRRGLAKRLRFYLTMLDMLERHGYIRPAWQSPFQFAEELADANPLRFDPVIALTELFYEIRFGHRMLDDDRRQRIRVHLKQLEHALARPGE